MADTIRTWIFDCLRIPCIINIDSKLKLYILSLILIDCNQYQFILLLLIIITI